MECSFCDGNSKDLLIYLAIVLINCQQFANSVIGWISVIGATLDIPFLLRSICARGNEWTVNTRLSISPEMIALLESTPDATLSPYLRPAPDYIHQWWSGETDSGPSVGVITPDSIRLSKDYHLRILREDLTEPPIQPGPF